MHLNQQRNRRRGSSMIEFALIFLPLVVLLTGVFEIGRAMWTYHSVSAAVKRAARYTVVRGSSCAAESSGCAPSVADVAAVIRQEAAGLEPERVSLTLEAGAQTIQCSKLTDCLADSSYWPAAPNNAVGRMVSISAEYSFDTFLFAFWSGPQPTGFSFQAESKEVIQF